MINAYNLHPKTKSELAHFIRSHVSEMAFNNADVLLGKEMSLELSRLQQKVLHEGKGGYCFELNRLCYEHLDQLGWNVQLTLARVLSSPTEQRPRTHRITLLDIESRLHVVDVGFGHLGPRLPVPLDGEVVSCDQFEWRIEKSHATFLMQTLIGGHWKTLYSFDQALYNDQDAELAHFWSHQSPDASFRNRLYISCCPEAPIAPCITNLFYKEQTPSGIEEHFIEGVDKFSALIRDRFSLDLPSDEVQELYQQATTFHQERIPC